MSVVIRVKADMSQAYDALKNAQKKTQEAIEESKKAEEIAALRAQASLAKIQRTVMIAGQVGQLVKGQMGSILGSLATVGSSAIMMYEAIASMAAASGVGAGTAIILQGTIAGMGMVMASINVAETIADWNSDEDQYTDILNQLEVF